jgi:hypothetical protein
MELNDFVSIHHNCGFILKKINGLYFLNRGLVNYSFPQLVHIPVNGKLIKMLKWRYPISVIKTESRIKNTYEYILNTEEYSLDSFRKRTRTTIKKSLNTCEFKRPPFEDLIHYGLIINRQTLKLQNRNDKFLTNDKLWEKYISFFYHEADSYILGAYMNGKMIGFAIAYRLEGKYYFHIQHIDRNYGTFYPMSGLMFKIVNQIIEKNGTIEISDGIESFNPLPSLNKFKRYMRFERVPVTRVYVIHPILVAVFKSIVFYYVHLLGKRTIRNQYLRQIISLYHGNRVLSRIIG